LEKDKFDLLLDALGFVYLDLPIDEAEEAFSLGKRLEKSINQGSQIRFRSNPKTQN
jgi:hypothetical protein